MAICNLIVNLSIKKRKYFPDLFVLLMLYVGCPVKWFFNIKVK